MADWKERAKQSYLQHKRLLVRAESNPDELLFIDEAADIMGMTREMLVSHMDNNTVEYVGEWPDRRIRASVALAAKAKRDRRVSEALAELTRISEEAGYR